jgi:hypothetical protein
LEVGKRAKKSVVQDVSVVTKRTVGFFIVIKCTE